MMTLIQVTHFFKVQETLVLHEFDLPDIQFYVIIFCSEKYSLYAIYSVLHNFDALDLTKISCLLTFLRKITAVCLLF